MLKDITKREKLLGAITLAAALAALGYNFIIEPLAVRWNALKEEIREKELLLTKHNRILRNKDVITELNAALSNYLQKKKLTPEEDSAAALSNIEKEARAANVHITNIKPLAIKKFEDYTKFTYRVSSESTMGELAKFIYNLQSSEQLLKVERMVLRAKERDPRAIKAMLHITKISVF